MEGQQNQAGGPGGQAQDKIPDLEKLRPTGEEIIEGARNEDQLDQMRQAAADEPKEISD